MAKISIYKSQKSFNYTTFDLKTIIELTRQGQWKKEIAEVRNVKEHQTKSKYQAAKQEILPAIMPSAIFTDGKSKVQDNFEGYTGIICLDIDGLNQSRLNDLKEKFKKNPFVQAFFVSPSGEGLKVFIPVTTSAEQHLVSWFALRNYFEEKYKVKLDEKCKNINRICYVSHDTDAWYKDDIKPFDPYFRAFEKLQLYAEKREAYQESNRNQHIFLVACNCRDHGIPVELTISYCINFFTEYVATDGQEQLRKTVRSAYDGRPHLFGNFLANVQNRKFQFNNYRNTGTAGRPEKPSRADTGKNGDKIHLQAPPDDEEFSAAMEFLKNEKKKEKNDSRVKETSSAYWTGGTQLTNFKVNVRYQIEVNDEEHLLVIDFQSGKRKTTRKLKLEQFLSLQGFKVEIKKAGSFTFWGKEADLNNIADHVLREVPICRSFYHMGQQKQKDIYAFANGVLQNNKFLPVDDYGVVPVDDEHYFLPAFSKVYEDQSWKYETQRKFRYQADFNCTLKYFLEKLVEFYGDNAKIGLAFAIASLYRDIITRPGVFMPLLFAYGQKGSGKSAFAEMFVSLFGDASDQVNLNTDNTAKGISRFLASKRNAMVFVDEYKNSRSEEIIQLLTSIYNGIGYVRAQRTNGLEQESVPVYSSVLVAGQEMPVKFIELFDRVVLLRFHERNFGDSRHAFANFKKEIDRGIGHIIGDLLQYRSTVEENFHDYYSSAQKTLWELLKNKDFEIADRSVNNLAAILAPMQILMDKKKIDLGDLDPAELVMIATRIISTQASLITENAEVNAFWEIFSHLASLDAGDNNRLREDYDYTICSHGLAVRMKNVWPRYMIHHYATYRKPGLDKSSLIDYLKHHPAYVPNGDDSKPFKVRFPNDNTTTAYCFDLAKLHDMQLLDIYFNDPTGNKPEDRTEKDEKEKKQKDEKLPF